MAPVMVGSASAMPAPIAAVAAVQSSPDCDHHQTRQQEPFKQTQKTNDHGTCMVGCTLCFVFVGVDVAVVAYSVAVGTALKPVHLLERLVSLTGSPPFRPPRA